MSQVDLSERCRLMIQCRMARDVLFSARYESKKNDERVFLFSGLEVEATQLWKKISQKIQNLEYTSSKEFMEDMYPIKEVLRKSHVARGSGKQVDIIFDQMHEIVSPGYDLGEMSPSPCEELLDVLGEHNLGGVLEQIRKSGVNFASIQKAIFNSRSRNSIILSSKDDLKQGPFRQQNSNISIPTTSGKKRRRPRQTINKNADSKSYTPHDSYHGVGVRENYTVNNSDTKGGCYYAYITVCSKDGTSSFLLQEDGFYNAEDAARVHDLACIRAWGPHACFCAHDSVSVASGEEDNSKLLNFDISHYAEEDIQTFLKWDHILLDQLARIDQWPGLQSCDFSFLLLAAPASSKRPTQPITIVDEEITG